MDGPKFCAAGSFLGFLLVLRHAATVKGCLSSITARTYLNVVIAHAFC